MNLDIRPCRSDEIKHYLITCEAAFGIDIRDEHIERLAALIEPERTLAAFDDGAMVGTTGAYRFTYSVPGGDLPATGVTFTGVLPSHRRRGVLTALMRRQLDDARSWNEPIAVLWASEGTIYQRFGYGMATQQAAIDIDRHHVRFRDSSPPRARATFLTEEEAVTAIGRVYERIRAVTPGMFARTEDWWRNHRLPDPEEDRDGAGPMFRVLFELDGNPCGYALYRVRNSWGDDGLPRGEIEVLEAMGVDGPSTREVWMYLFGVDLVARLKSYFLPADLPLKWMLEEPRRLRANVRDAVWLRIVDLPSALAGRSYQHDGSIVFDFRDEFCSWNAGVWRFDVANGRGRAVRSEEEPQARFGAEELGAVYLGGATWSELARAGRVEELQDGGLRTLDSLFAADVNPWCPEIF
jgi:predicted acetyltransferase